MAVQSNREGFLKGRLLPDTILSGIASLASILLVRWISAAPFGFTRHVVIFVVTTY